MPVKSSYGEQPVQDSGRRMIEGFKGKQWEASRTKFDRNLAIDHWN
jgi:hypothetical protein